MQLKKLITISDSGENLSRYFTEIRQYEPLSKQEEKALIEDFQKTGNKVAQDKIIKANLKFVVTMAKQYQGQGGALSDLISQGHLGLLEALNRFDTSKDLKFFSYAVWWMRRYMFTSLYNDTRAIELPDNRALMVSRIKKEAQLLEQHLQRYPSLDELLEFIKETYPVDTKEGKVFKSISKDDLYEAIMLGGKKRSLQDHISNALDDACTLEDTIPSEDTAIDEEMKQESLLKDLEAFFFQLNQMEYDVLILTNGLNGELALKSYDIARLFVTVLNPSVKAEDIPRLTRTKEKEITKLKNRAVKRLKKLKNINSLRTYL